MGALGKRPTNICRPRSLALAAAWPLAFATVVLVSCGDTIKAPSYFGEPAAVLRLDVYDEFPAPGQGLSQAALRALAETDDGLALALLWLPEGFGETPWQSAGPLALDLFSVVPAVDEPDGVRGLLPNPHADKQRFSDVAQNHVGIPLLVRWDGPASVRRLSVSLTTATETSLDGVELRVLAQSGALAVLGMGRSVAISVSRRDGGAWTWADPHVDGLLAGFELPPDFLAVVVASESAPSALVSASVWRGDRNRGALHRLDPTTPRRRARQAETPACQASCGAHEQAGCGSCDGLTCATETRDALCLAASEPCLALCATWACGPDCTALCPRWAAFEPCLAAKQRLLSCLLTYQVDPCGLGLATLPNVPVGAPGCGPAERRVLCL